MTLWLRRVCGVLLSALSLTCLSVCSGKSPSGPGPTTSPTPNTGPTPTSTPTADPPVSASCVRIGYGTEALKCPMQVAQFQNEVDQAIRTLQHERPEIFKDRKSTRLNSSHTLTCYAVLTFKKQGASPPPSDASLE